MRPEQVLAALADLAPAPAERAFDVTAGGQPFLWLGERDRVRPGRTADRLAGLDALHYDERILRRGVGFVVGQAEADGTRRTVRLPLLVQPVRLEGRRSRYRLVPAGDPELTPLVEDHEVAARLESVPGLDRPGWLAGGEAEEWIRTAAQAAGLPISGVAKKPPRPLPADGLVGVAASALFVAREARVGGVRQTLVAWSRRAGLAETALATVYGLDGRAEAAAAPEQTAVTEPAATEPAATEPEEILSPIRLNAAQRDVVSRVRREPLVVVTGPPGNGKSHALVAAALDTVDRGGSVLMVAQSAAAVSALATLLGRFGGPTPVLFGDAEHRETLLAMLERGLDAGAGGAEIRAARAAVAAARERLAALRSGVVATLETEQRAAGLPTWETLLPGLAVDAPAPFRPEFDLAGAESLWRAAYADHPDDSWLAWWRRWSARWGRRRLRRRLGATPLMPTQRLRAVLDAAGAVEAAGRLASTGGTDLTATWHSLLAAEADLAAAVGEAMRLGASSARRWAGDGRRAAVVLAAALRAGRNRRRQILADLDGPVLVRALPLWIGTVTDVEDLLPPVPGLFDLVVVDEAVHVDQIRAAPVLARGRRALVAGDPRQLRFVSFVADVDVALTLRRHGLTAATDRIDVRRASAFDLAAGAAAVTSLTAHYRSAPHLIEFSARRFYGGRVELMTRHPRNEDGDHIDVIRVDGRVVDGVNQVEVAAVVEAIRELASAGAVDIGVVSPFRAQADALESALLAAFSVDEIKKLRLRTGTVYAFQGGEAETVIASLALMEGDAAARSRFVADPNLFNVLVTRARQRMIVVTSLDNVDGLVGEYLRYAERPRPPRPDGDKVEDDWTRRLAVELRRAGAVVRPDYPVGPWRIDLCLGPGAGAVGLICRVHPDGVRAHIERQLALLAAGWRLVDAFPSRWGGEATRAAVELAAAAVLPPTHPTVDHDPQFMIDAI